MTQPNQTNQLTVRRVADVPLDSIDLIRATDLCKKSPDIAGQLIMALLTQHTASLPDTIFVRREDGKFLKKNRTTIRLNHAAGHLINVKGKKEVSLAGWRKINEFCGVQTIRPSTVTVDGRAQMNPYIQVDPTSRMPEVVYARCVAVGYSTIGSLIATDAMVRLDINIYLLEAIHAKVKEIQKDRNAAAGASFRVAKYGTKDKAPTAIEGAEWVFMPVHSVGGIGLWVNMAAPEFQDALQEHTTRLKFIERLAQSFAERNALKAHPGMPKTFRPETNAENCSSVVCTAMAWTTDFAMSELDKLRELIDTGTLSSFRDGAGKSVQVTEVAPELVDPKEAVRVDDDGEGPAGGQESEEEGGTGGAVSDPVVEENPSQEDPLGDATDYFSQLATALTRGRAKKILNECGIKQLDEGEPEALKAFINKAKEVLGANNTNRGQQSQG